MICFSLFFVFFFQAEDGIRDLVRSRGLGDVYKRQVLLRAGLVRLLEEGGHEIIGAVGDAGALVDAARTLQPELALVDVRMPPTLTDDGLRAALVIRRDPVSYTHLTLPTSDLV